VGRVFATWRGEAAPDTIDVPAGSEMAKAAAVVQGHMDAAAADGADGAAGGGSPKRQGKEAGGAGRGAEAAAKAGSGGPAAAAGAAAEVDVPRALLSPDGDEAESTPADAGSPSRGPSRGPSFISTLLRRGSSGQPPSGLGRAGSGSDAASLASAPGGGGGGGGGTSVELASLMRPPSSVMEAAVLAELEDRAVAAAQVQGEDATTESAIAAALLSEGTGGAGGSNRGGGGVSAWRRTTSDERVGDGAAAAMVAGGASGGSSATTSLSVPSVRIRRRLLQTCECAGHVVGARPGGAGARDPDTRRPAAPNTNDLQSTPLHSPPNRRRALPLPRRLHPRARRAARHQHRGLQVQGDRRDGHGGGGGRAAGAAAVPARAAWGQGARWAGRWAVRWTVGAFIECCCCCGL
jgi:hypothetical protein